jgi:gliding motility-associated-like protein
LVTIDLSTLNSVGNTSYSWTNSAPSIGLPDGDGNNISFIAINDGTQPIIATIVVTPTYTNAGVTCTGNPVTFTITVNPNAQVNDPTNQVFCNGTNTSVINFTTENTLGSTIYNWTNSNPSIGLLGSGSGSIQSFSAINNGPIPLVATIEVTPTYTYAGVTCTGDPKTFTITINPSGVVDQPNPQVFCNESMATINLTTTSSVGVTSYSWTNTAPSIGLQSGAGSNIPTFMADNPGNSPVVGTIVVTPTFTYAGLSCVGISKTFTVTVNPSPQVNTVDSQVVCHGNFTNLVNFTTTNTGGTTGGVTTYNWTNNNISIGLSASGTGDILPFIALNTGSNVQVATITVTPTYTNAGVSCDGTPITFTITVNPKAQVIPPTSQVFCAGSPAVINLNSITTGANTTYQWTTTNSSIGLFGGSGSNIPPFIATNSGTAPVDATITVTPTFTNAGISCIGTQIVFTITVNPEAQVNSISSIVKCYGDVVTSIPLTTNNTSGITTYTWTSSDPSIGLNSGSGNIIPPFNTINTSTVPKVATITVTPTYTNAGISCIGEPISFTVTVNPSGQANQITTQAFCNGLSTNAINLNTNNTQGNTTYTWTNSNPNIGLIGPGSNFIPSFTATNPGTNPITGTINVTPTFTNAGLSCIGNPMTFTISVNPNGQVNPISSFVKCNGDSVGQTDVNLTTINSGGTTTYSWTNTVPSIGLNDGSGLNLPLFTATNSGPTPIVASVVVTPSFTNPGVTCPGAPVTFTITVNPSAQVIQPASQVVCDGQPTTTVIFNTLNTGGTTTYNWTNSISTGYLPAIGNGNTIPSFIPTNTGTAPITHTITVTPTYTANGITCIGTPKTFTITVNPKPQVNPVGPQVICNGDQTNLVNFTTINTGGVTTYDWANSIPTIGLAASGSGPIPAFTAVNTGTTPIVHTITVTPKFENGGTTCTGTPMTFTITVNPTPQVSTPLPLEYCNGNTVNLNLALNTIAGTTYNWTNSNQSIGLNSSGGTGLIPTFTAVNIGTLPIVSTITVSPVYSNAGLTCNGAPVTFTVTINPSPTASITGVTDTIVCQNAPQPVITFTGSNGVAPYTFNYQLVGPPPTNTVSLSAVSVGDSASITIPTSVFGAYTVTLLSVQGSGPNSCPTLLNPALNSTVIQVIENATVAPFSGALVSQTVCQNVAITPILFTIAGSSNNAYVTGLPSGMLQSYSSGVLTIYGTPTSTGVYNYVVHTTGSANGCDTNYAAGTITVNSNGSISAITPVNQTVCANSALTPILFNLSVGATGGIVTFSNPQPSGITWAWNNITKIITIQGTPTTPGTYTYTVQSLGICGQSTATGTIIIKDTPTISLVSGNASPTVCMNTSFTNPIQYSISTGINPPIVPINMILSPGSILPNGVTFNSGTGIISGTPTESGTFPYTIISDNGCGNSLPGIITVNPLQSISYVSGNINQAACQNSPVDPINLLTSAGVTSVTVSPALPTGINIGFGGGIVTISGTPTTATSAPTTYTISTQGGCGLTAQTSFTLNVRPEATITVNSGSITQSVCQSSAIDPIVFTIGGGATGIAPITLPLGLTLTQTGPTTYTIQGNPVTGGSFTINTTGCPKSLTINISNLNTNGGLFLNALSGPVSQTICQTAIPGPIQPIIYDISGGVTGITSFDLPLGVTANIIGSQVIISGIPTISGVYNYSITTQPCSIVKSGVIKVSSQIYINSTITHISCHEENDGKILVSIAGGLPYINPANGQALYAIQWTGPNNFQQNQSYIEGLEAGDYTISVSDANGCPSPFPVTMTYTILDTPAITVSPNLTLSTPNTGCNGELGDMYFNISGGSGIYTLFTLQFLDPNSGNLIPITPPFGNYYHITNLQAGIYYLTVKDSRNCTATTSFVINDFSTLSIDSITMDNNLCADEPGKIRVKVNSLDPNLNFFYNGVLVTAINLGNGIYELSINTPTPNGIVKVINSQNCSVTEIISTPIITPDFEFTSNDFENYGYFSVNQSIEFTQLFNTSFIPAEYHYIVWDFGDNTPFKEFDNVEDLDLIDIKNVFHTYSANGIYEITLTVYNRFGCSRKITKIIKVGTGATIMLPTIFTPNNDGINDYFRPSTIGLKKVAMFIYDKWGNLVYEFSSDVSSLELNWGWNGIEKGKTEPINNDYRYYIIGTTINDINEEKEGRFLLVK